MQLSIIIISYRTRQLLQNCLNSIFQSKIPFNYEIIVIDNNSDDGSVEMIKEKFKSVKLIENQNNVGYGAANNQAMKEAQGRYILLLNSDTEIIDEAIDKMVNWLEKHQETGVVGCQLLYKNGLIQQSAGFTPTLSKIFFWATFLDDLPIIRELIKPYHLSNLDFYKKEQEVGWVTGAFFLLKREIFEKLGGFDEKIFMYTEEIDWCLTIKKAGWKIFYTPIAVIYHYQSASPRKLNENAILAEFKGLRYLFKKHMARWKQAILPFILKTGALLRVLVFSIIGDRKKAKIYEEAFKLA